MTPKKKVAKKKATKKKMKRNVNPFYVISKKRGKEIEIAKNAFDATMKRLGLAPLLEVIAKILQTLGQMVKSYATLEVLIGFLDRILSSFQGLDKLFRPIFSAS